MRLAARALGAGLVSVGLGLGSIPGRAQSTTTPQNNVPDAPRPQTLPQLNTVTPTAPAVPNAPLPNAPTAQPDAAAAENGGIVPGTSLPSSPASAPAQEGQTPGAQDPANNGPVAQHASDIRVVVNFVEIPFTVKDSKGNYVPGLTWRDVRVYENGVRQAPRLFTADPIPLSMAIVIDQSVTFDTMEKINASLAALQGAFAPYDEVAIFTYNNGVKEQTSFSGAQSARVTFALERSKSPGREPNMAMGGALDQTTVKNNLPVDPNTNRNTSAGVILQTPEREYHTLNDAILTAAEQVAKAGKGRRRVIFVISDGREYGSQAKEKEVIRFLQAHEISLYATLVGESSVPGVDFLDKFHLPLTMRDNVLPRYVSATGGDYEGAFRPRAIEHSFAKLTGEVRTEYTIGYYSHEPFIDGKYRSVDVRVLRPNLDVIAKKGYWPTASDAVQGRPVPTPRTGDTPAAPTTPPPGSTPPTP